MTVSEDKPEFEGEGDLPPHFKLIMNMIEKNLGKLGMPMGAHITFLVTQAELSAHLHERADHYQSEVRLLREGQIEPKVLPYEDAAMLPGPMSPELKPSPETIAAIKAERLRFAIDTAATKARMFAFMAAHLSKAETFQMDPHTAASYELIPSLDAAAYIGPRYGAALGRVPGL